jgi:hypothetical protein
MRMTSNRSHPRVFASSIVVGIYNTPVSFSAEVPAHFILSIMKTGGQSKITEEYIINQRGALVLRPPKAGVEQKSLWSELNSRIIQLKT